MRRPTFSLGILLGALISSPLVALFFLGEQLAALPFVPFDLFDWLARVLPGNVVTLGIDSIVGLVRLVGLGPTDRVAKGVEQAMAIGLVVVAGGVLGGLLALAIGRTTRPGWQVGAGGGLLLALLVGGIEVSAGVLAKPVGGLLWIGLLLAGGGALLGHALSPAAEPTLSPQDRAFRRALLAKMAVGSAGVVLGAWGLGRLLGSRPAPSGAGQPLPGGAASVPPTPTPPLAAGSALPGASPQATLAVAPRDFIAPAPGTRPEVTPTEAFYRIDINARPVSIEGDSWVLQVDGLFDNPRPLTLADLMAYPPVTQAITLSCISNPIGGDLIGTGYWTGVRLRDLLQDLGLRPEARELYVEAADGFYESVAMADLMDPRTLLVYGMNGETLPVEHGYPLRIYIPNRYGMKQPKWITRIEAIDREGPGYWVDRGWSAEARPRIISVIDTVAVDQQVDGKVPIGGIAWAGDRGIQKVEVQVDGGPWVEAVLRTPPLSPLTWVQWRYDWPAVPGRHTFRVRATDGTGALQIEERRPTRPDGATGYHEVTVTI